MKELIIVGAGGLGREVAWLVERINEINPTWKLLGFIDDNLEISGQIINDYPVLGDCQQVIQYPDAWYVCAIGNAEIRKKITQKLGAVHYAILIDPSVIISSRVKLGEGSIICFNSVVTVEVTIGKHTIVNYDCTVGHDAVIEDYTTLYPSVNVSGSTHISSMCEIGTGTQIIQGKKIGNNTIIGAGSVVIRDIPSHCTAVGNPAKPIKFA